MKETQVFYQCQRCGNCCKWPGRVRITAEDLDKIALYLKSTPEEISEKFTDLDPSRKFLILKNKKNGECIFLEGSNTCLVQRAKPLQCTGFPNQWNFPGWREVCEAIPVKKTTEAAHS